jgi:hypothetical protein
MTAMSSGSKAPPSSSFISLTSVWSDTPRFLGWNLPGDFPVDLLFLDFGGFNLLLLAGECIAAISGNTRILAV